MSEKYAFAEPEILRMDADVLADYMKHSELKLYQHMIDDMLSQKEHTLSEKEELLLAKASQVMSVRMRYSLSITMQMLSLDI